MKKCFFVSGWGHGRAPMQALAEAMACSRLSVSSLADLDRGEGRCPDYAAELVVNLDREGADQVILVGWSTGGMVVLEAALRRPEKIAGLVLISSTPRFCRVPAFPWGVEEAELRAMKIGVRRKFKKTIAEFRQKSAWPRELTGDQIEAALAEAEGEGILSLERGLTYLQQVDLRAYLEKAAFPCLLLHGKSDRIISWKATEWMSSIIKHSRCRIWPEQGHELAKKEFSGLVEEIKLFAGNLV